MYILDNIIFSLQKSGGISAVWYEHLKRLLENNKEIKIIEYDTALENLFRKELIIDESIITTKSSEFLNLKRYLNPKFSSENVSTPFIFHSSYYRTCRNKNAVNITTVHDFTYEYYSKWLPKTVHCLQKYNAIRNSDFIICISENTKKDLLQFLPDVDENKIHVIYNGVSEDYFPLRVKYGNNERPFALFVGAREGYKNFALAVEAIADTTFQLKIVGSPLNESEEQLLKTKLGDNRYQYVGRITNNELNKLYNSAFCLLYPSSYEGFGIPVIEAQKAGCPVIAANRSSIPEIVGDKSLLIDCLTAKDITDKINLLKNNSIRDELIAIGLENSKRFSWDNTFSATLDVYREAENLIH